MTPIVAALCVLVATSQGPTFDEAWKFEQAARGAAGEKMRGEKSTPALIREGIRDAETVLAYTYRPEIEPILDSAGNRAFVLQRNDIYIDLIGGYARLKDVENVTRYTRMLRESLEGKDGNAKWRGRFSTYAGLIEGNTFVKALPPNKDFERELRAIRLKDPDLYFNAYPFALDDAPKVSEADRVAGLSLIWSEAKYNFANFDLVRDLDWNEAYATYLPKVRAARDRYEYYGLLREFIALLKDSHTNITLPPTLREERETSVRLPTALVEGKVVVYLTPVKPVADLGISKGDVVETVDGKQALSYAREKWEKWLGCSTPQDLDVRLYTMMLLRGPKDSTARLGIRKADGSTKQVTVKRDPKMPGIPIPAWEFKKLPDGTAYFAFNTCNVETPMEGFRKSLPAIREAGRLVIDVRINEGGSSEVGWTILSHLINTKVQVNRWETRQYRAAFRPWGRDQENYKGEPDFIDPNPDRFDGPVVVLMGSRTFSAAEDFVSVCKTSKRVTLMGEPTGGSTGQPLTFRLPAGGTGRICTKRDRLADGTEFIGKGVMPDITVRQTIAALQQDRDIPLERAIEELKRRG